MAILIVLIFLILLLAFDDLSEQSKLQWLFGNFSIHLWCYWSWLLYIYMHTQRCHVIYMYHTYKTNHADFSFNCLHLSWMFFGALPLRLHLSLNKACVFNSGLLLVTGHSFSNFSASSIVHFLL